MQQKEYEMPDEYKQNLAHLAEFIDERQGWQDMITDGLARGVRVSPADKAMVDEKLREFDQMVENLEQRLADEYERYQAEKAHEDEMSELLDKANETSKRLYIIIKHQTPHLLEEFTKCLDPLLPEEREQFLDEVAILEATKLDAILSGTEE